MPVDDEARGERWAPGPALPVETRVPTRFRGAMLMVAGMTLTVLLTWAIAPAVIGDPQDPALGGAPTGEPSPAPAESETPTDAPTESPTDAPTDAPTPADGTELPGEG